MPTIAPLKLDHHCIATGFMDDIPHFITSDGSIHWLNGGHRHITPHDGILSAVIDPKAGILTGGEDGMIRLGGAMEKTIETHQPNKKWITACAIGPNGTFAWSVGKTVHVRLANGTLTEITHERSLEGLAFAPKGFRLALAHYNGVSLYFPGTESPPKTLAWKGAHTDVCFSPDGLFVVSTMQENALHGWRLKDGQELRMRGYPSKVKTYSWSAKGKYLATSGAPAAICWPFAGKEGPIGKKPLELATRGQNRVTSLACHPTEDVVAIGFDDGMILAARFHDDNQVVLKRPSESPISALNWDKTGLRASFGSEDGSCGVIDIRA